MYCVEGKAVDVWADNEGGLWYLDDDNNSVTLDESKYKPLSEKEAEDVTVQRKTRLL